MKFHAILFQINQASSSARSLGSYRIAQHLRDQGWDVEVVEYAYFWKLEHLKELVKSRTTVETKFFGFGHLFSIWSDTLEEFCKWVKQEYPTIKLLSGSAVNPAFDSKYIDYYIQGFGEVALDVLLQYIFNNAKSPSFKFDAPKGKKIIPATTFYPAFPMKSLMVKYEDRDFILPNECLSIEFARGCMFSCDFCNFPVLGVKGDHTRDSEDAYIQFMDAYDRFGVTNYQIVDETFNDRTDKITKFADVVERLPWNPIFSAFIRADLLVSRPLDRVELSRMGVLGHFYGIESFNHASAKSVGKGMNPDRIKQGLIDIKNYFLTNDRKKYRGTISLILGLPHETFETIDITLNWLINNWQGQNTLVFPLSILLHELDTPSKFSLNYKKYGYREITTNNRIDENFNLEKLNKYGVISDNPFLNWENDHMNYTSCREKASQILAELKQNDLRANIFELMENFYFKDKGFLTYEEKYQSETWNGIFYQKENNNDIMIKNYINKKLSL
jgi:radical SAM superfamily enzyme YgiQ (UPF0313 family)